MLTFAELAKDPIKAAAVLKPRPPPWKPEAKKKSDDREEGEVAVNSCQDSCSKGETFPSPRALLGLGGHSYWLKDPFLAPWEVPERCHLP